MAKDKAVTWFGHLTAVYKDGAIDAADVQRYARFVAILEACDCSFTTKARTLLPDCNLYE